MSIQESPQSSLLVEPPVVLQEEPARVRGMMRDLVHALAELGVLVGQELRAHAMVARLPRDPAVVAPVGARRRDGDHHAPARLAVPDEGVQAEPSRPRLPALAVGMVKETLHRLPRVPGVARLEEARGLDPQADDIGLGLRPRPDLPDALERELRILREPDRALILPGPAPPEIVGEAERRPPEGAPRCRPQARSAGAAVVRHRIDFLSGEVRPAQLPAAAVARSAQEGPLCACRAAGPFLPRRP